jgi:plastocyanin
MHHMTKRLTFFSVLSVTIALAFTILFAQAVPQANATATVAPEDLQAGDLIRGEGFSAVYYYGADGFRYVFPNDKAYFTWYDNFDDVLWLTDSDMSSVQIGGNVTYKPGVRMIKINSDPTVYAVESGGVIRSIPSESVATDLYGSNWNTMIDDVPDGFFSNYTMGSALEFSSQYDASAEEADANSIGSDRDLQLYTTVTVGDSGFSPSSVTIEAGTAVRFVSDSAEKHGASADDGSWGTGTLNEDGHFSRYFEAGTYEYHDKYDSAVTATITAQ